MDISFETELNAPFATSGGLISLFMSMSSPSTNVQDFRIRTEEDTEESLFSKGDGDFEDLLVLLLRDGDSFTIRSSSSPDTSSSSSFSYPLKGKGRFLDPGRLSPSDEVSDAWL